MRQEWSKARVIGRINGVPLKARPSFWPMWLSTWPLLVVLARRRKRGRSWKAATLVGTLAFPLPILADVGHAAAHTVTAKAAHAPMDEIHLAADMPRTIYFDDDVTPDQHRLRALGGPIYSFMGLLVSLLWRKLAKRGTVARELAEISAASHGLILLGCLFPLPMVDGGTFLKWTLVDKGMPRAEADLQVKRAGILSITAVLLGVLFWLFRRRAAVDRR